jgi:hypothetical protein
MKKILLFTVIGIYLTFGLFSPVVLAEDTPENSTGSGLFTPEIELDIDSEIEKPISTSESKDITFKVKFKLNLGSIAYRLFFNRRIGRAIMFGFTYFFKFLNQLPKVNLTLSVEAPDGCQVGLDKEKVELDYNNEFEEVDVKLTITLDDDVIALQKMDVKIKADYPGLGRIAAFSNNTTISFMPDYVSNISVELDSELKIPPLKETMVPINITNNGNGESNVIIGIKNFNQNNWNITFDKDEITIGVEQTKSAMMYVKPPKEFNFETLTLMFTPTSTVEDVDDSYRQGDSVDSDITFKNDGSLEDDEDFDVAMILIIAIVVLIAFVLIAFFLKKRK